MPWRTRTASLSERHRTPLAHGTVTLDQQTSLTRLSCVSILIQQLVLLACNFWAVGRLNRATGMLKTSSWLVLAVFFPLPIYAQWTDVGPLPSPPIQATATYAPPNAQPYSRAWSKPIYDPIDKKLLFYLANPNCCYGTFSNAMFGYTAATNAWSLFWSHMTGDSVYGDAVTSISRTSNVVTITLSQPHPDIKVGDTCWIRGVIDASFNGICTVASVLSSTSFTFNQTGPNATSSAGTAYDPVDAKNAPADRHPYNAVAWDSTRDVLWTGFGSASMGNSQSNLPCGDCGISDLYKMTVTNGQGNWTQVCGNVTTWCPPGPLQESAAAYDATSDVLVIYGGLLQGTPTANTWLYYPATNTWQAICGSGLNACGPPQVHRQVMFGVGNGTILMFAGQDQTGAYRNDVWLFNTTTKRWSITNPSLKPPATGFPVADYVSSLNALIYIDPQSPTTTWAFSLSTGQWVGLNISGGPSLSSNLSANAGGYDPNAGRFIVYIGGGDLWTLALPSSLPSPTTTPIVGLSPTSVSFPTQAVGTASVAQQVTVTNTGTTALTITSIAIAGTNTADFGETNTCPISPATLAASSNCVVSIRFKPSRVGTESAALSISDNAFGSPQSVSLSGQGTTTAVRQGWTAVSPLPSPPIKPAGTYTPSNASPYIREWTKPVYDSTNLGVLVYFADPDCCFGTFSNAVFLYHVSTNSWQLMWSHMTIANTGGLADAPDAPADNHPYHAMAWDSTRGVLWKAFGSAQVGGETGNCGDCGVSDTYKFDTTMGQGLWTEVCGNTMTPCPPGPLQETTLAYDPTHDTLVLYGGLKGGTPTADTWEYTPSNNTWTKICGSGAPALSTCGPPLLDAPGLVYDPALKQFVLFGGAVPTPGGSMNTTTWLYNVGTHSWTQVNTLTTPPASKFPVMDYVPRLGAVVLVGSESTGAHTWAFNGVQWVDLNIPGGPTLSTPWAGNQGAYDVSADRFVLFLPGSNSAGEIYSLDLPSSLNVPPRPGPAATVSQANVSFPAEALGTVSSVQSLVINNTGTAPLTFSNITITGTNSKDFTQTNTCPVPPSSLAAGTSCTVSLTFQPSIAGNESAMASIADNASTGSPQAILLQGTGIANGPAVSLSATALAFANQPENTLSAAQTLTIRNTGSAALTINSITITGTNSRDFVQTNNCPVSPATLVAGGSCSIAVTFTPSAIASESATMSIASNAPSSPRAVVLEGSGTANSAGISLFPSVLTFPNQPENTPSKAQTLTISNMGSAALTINRITIAGINSSDFAQTNNCPISPATLAVGGSCTIAITFTPSAVASESATISVASDAPGSPQTASVRGTGYGVGAMSKAWTAIGSLPSPPIKATGTYAPFNATPYFRISTKPVYDTVNKGLLLYWANPNCCYGSFSNAVFLYRVSVNSWTNFWSHQTALNQSGPADMVDAPSDNIPYHALAWDTRRHVLWKGFGSATTGGTSGDCGDCGVNDFYKFDTTGGKGTWTELCGNGLAECAPGVLQETAFAYDSARDVVVMYGGLKHGTPNADTWEYTPTKNSWTRICGEKQVSCGPPPLNGEGFVYDPALQGFVLFGGSSSSGALNGDTWLYSAATQKWRKITPNIHPPAQMFPVMDYVPRLRAVVLVGSESTGAHTWAFDGAQWIDLNLTAGPVLSKAAQENQGAYDVSADRFVLFLPGNNAVGAIWSLNLPSSLSVSTPVSSPAATLSQASVSFQAQSVGTLSSARRLTITSSGNAALTIARITITGTNSKDFTQTNNCPISPATLAAGGSCTITVTFMPSAAGTDQAVLTVSDNAVSSPQNVSLTGIGTNSSAGFPNLTVSPSSLNFGSQPSNTTSAPQTVTLSNSGAAPLTFNSVSITGANSSNFSETNNCPVSPATLPGGASCLIHVTFTPSAPGIDQAALSISDTAAGSPQTASISGTGTSNGSNNGGGTSGPAAQFPIALTVQEAIYPGVSGVDRTQDPVTVGIPLPDKAGITDTSTLGLTGTSVGQFRVLGRWPSGNVKWLRVDTQADETAGGQNVAISLTNSGSGNFGGGNLAADNGSTITIGTGTATFIVKKANFDLLDSVIVGGKNLVSSSSAGLTLVGPTPGNTTCPCSTVYASSNDPNSTAVIEENGPVRAAIKVMGQLMDSSGNAYMRYTVRLHFFYNKSYVKADMLLQNADYGTSGTFATAYRGFGAFEARLTPTLGKGKTYEFGTSSTPTTASFSGSENAYIYQAYSNDMEDCDWVAPDPRYDPRSYIARQLLGTTLTKANCQSTWSYAQTGYEVVDGTTLLANGTMSQYPQGWADLRDSTGAGIEVGVYQMAAYWPKSLQFMNGGSEIRIGIWPDQSLFLGGSGQQYFQSWPQYSEHTLYLNFHGSALPAPDSEFLKFQYPLIARADLASYNNAQVFPFQLLSGAAVDSFYQSLGMYCCISDITPHVYRTYNWPAPGGGNQAEMRWADLLLWLQRGYTGRYLNSKHFYTFLTEQVFPRSDYNGATPFNWRDSFVSPTNLNAAGFPRNITSLNNNVGCDSGATVCGRNWMEISDEHAHWYGMMDHYFITGDESVKDAIEDGISDSFGNPNVAHVVNGGYPNSRAIGVALMSDARLYNFYNAVGDTTSANNALQAADTVVNLEVRPELQVSGFGSFPKGVSRTRGLHFCCNTSGIRSAKPFMNGILNQGMWEYLQAHGSNWPFYNDTLDLAEGVASFTLNETFINTGTPDTGCHAGAGLTYEIDIDNSNNPLYPGCPQTVWFNFFIAAKYGNGNVPWKPEFETHLKHVDKSGPPGHWAEYGTFLIDAVINEVLNPEPSLVDVPLSVTNLGNGSYSISWTVPTGAQSYRIKYSAKNIVEWLNFNPVTNTFGIDANTNVPWFAATDVDNPPTPAAPGTTQSFTVTGLGSSQNFAMKAYVRLGP